MNLSKKCLICNRGQKNDTLYFNLRKPKLIPTDPIQKLEFLSEHPEHLSIYCCKCSKQWNILEYCVEAGLDFAQIMSANPTDQFTSNQLNSEPPPTLPYPDYFHPIFHPISQPAIQYLNSRKIFNLSNFAFDSLNQGVALPLYLESNFCGGQTRIINPIHTKITTLTGTKSSKLFWGWDQDFRHLSDKRGIIITEGAINAASLREKLGDEWLYCAISGSNLSDHHLHIIKKILDLGLRVILTPDNDPAGEKMLLNRKNYVIEEFSAVDDKYNDWNEALMDNQNIKEMFIKNLGELR